MSEVCENCRYFLDEQRNPGSVQFQVSGPGTKGRLSDLGMCRRSPPSAEKTSLHVGVYPAVAGLMWCGEWRPREPSGGFDATARRLALAVLAPEVDRAAAHALADRVQELS